MLPILERLPNQQWILHFKLFERGLGRAVEDSKISGRKAIQVKPASLFSFIKPFCCIDLVKKQLSATAYLWTYMHCLTQYRILLDLQSRKYVVCFTALNINEEIHRYTHG